MPQLAEARDSDDDWTGLVDAASRRKKQTRLSTRAYRRRKALRSGSPRPKTETPSSVHVDDIPCWDEDKQAITYLPLPLARALNRRGKPVLKKRPLTSSLIFPLSGDHLITLIQINVLRACNHNSDLLARVTPHTRYDCTYGALRIVPPVDHIKEVPSALAPTATQAAIPHKPWVDVLPHPGWRDNFLRALGTFDERELCTDLVGGLFDRVAGGERRGIVVWSPPWHYGGWELSEGFVRKWGWSIKGCEEVLEATNRWRASRGERPLRYSL